MNPASQIKIWQGTQTKGADNKFMNTQNYSIFDNVQQITYFHSSGGNRAPYNVNANYVAVVNNATANNCASTICSGGDVLLQLTEYKQLQQNYDAQTDEFNTLNYNDITMAYLNGETFPVAFLQPIFEKLDKIVAIGNQMRDISSYALNTILADKVLNTDLLQEWYNAIRTPIAKYSLAETYSQLGEFDKADEVLAEIPAMFDFSESEITEHNNYLSFHHIKKLLHTTHRMWPELNEEEIAELQNIALATNGRSATMAKGVLCFFYNICLDTEEEVFEIKSMQQNGNEAVKTKSNKENIVLVYPNPANDYINITSTDNKIKEVTLFDLAGKYIHSEKGNALSCKMNTSAIKKGIYLLKIHFENGEVCYKKIIKD
jgi:hypothetical protein